MESTITQISTHLVRQHRRVRRRLPELANFADLANASDERLRRSAARGALRLLERDVLAQVDVEDAFVAGSLDTSSQHRLRRLRPEHDSLRIGTDRLQTFVEEPHDPADVAGLLRGLSRLLTSHLHDEWHTLLPMLAELTHERATPLLSLLPNGMPDPTGPLTRLYVPCSFDQVRDRLTGTALVLVSERVQEAAVAAARRAAIGLAIPGGDSLRATVEIAPVIATPRVTLLIGRLATTETETVLAPVEFEVVLTPDGPDSTTLELRHDVVPTRPLPRDVPAHDVTGAAINALAGELARIGLRREPAAANAPRGS